MDKNNESNEKRAVAIDACLAQFVEKGLIATTSRDLSKALNLQTAGMYSYFNSKDDAVVACAEEAALRLENELISVAIENLTDVDKLIEDVLKKAKDLSPMMRFFTSVCSTQKYEVQMEPVLTRLSKRYEKYVTEFAEYTQCDAETIKPYIFIGITAIANYMVYQEPSYIIPQFDIVRKGFEKHQKVKPA